MEKILVMLIVGILVGGIIGYAGSYMLYTPQINELTTELSDLESQYGTISGQYDTLSQEHKILSQQYDTLSQEQENLLTQFDEIKASYDVLLQKMGHRGLIPDFKVVEIPQPANFVNLVEYDDDIYLGLGHVGGLGSRLLKTNVTGVLETLMDAATGQSLMPNLREIVDVLKTYDGTIFASLFDGATPPRIARYDPTTKAWNHVFTVPDANARTIYQMAINQRGQVLATVHSVVGGNGYIYRTDDLGESWTQVYSLEGVGMHAVAQGSRYNYIFAGSDDGRIFRSTWYGDAGTWAQVFASPYGNRIRGIITTPEANVIAADDKGHIFRSTDLGANWIEVADIRQGNSMPRCLCASPLGDLFYGSSSRIHRSTDDGLTWEPIFYMPHYGPGLRLRSIHASPTHLYIGTWYSIADSVAEMEKSARLLIVRYR